MGVSSSSLLYHACWRAAVRYLSRVDVSGKVPCVMIATLLGATHAWLKREVQVDGLTHVQVAGSMIMSRRLR